MYDPLRASNAIYLGNKMTDVPFFNAPWFDQKAAFLLSLPAVGEVFNPAAHDRALGFEPMNCPNGSAEEARAAGFSARKALGSDWQWIAEYSDGLIVGPDWASSPGTISEIACHQALRLPVWEFDVFEKLWNDDDRGLLFRLALPLIMDMQG